MSNVSDKILCIAIALAILGHAYWIRRLVGSWLFPAIIYNLFWFLYTFVPLVLVPAAPANPLAILYIFATCLVFSVPALFINWSQARLVSIQITSERTMLYDTAFLRVAFYFTTAVALILWIVNSFIQGISLRDIFVNTLESAAVYAGLRGSESLVANIFYQLANAMTYLAVPLGGFAFCTAQTRRSKSLAFVASILPSLFVVVTQSSKGIIFLSLSLFFGAVLVYRLNRGNYSLFGRIKISQIVAISLIIVPVITVSFLARGLYESQNTNFVLDQLFRYYVSYVAGHLYAFSDWFSWRIGMPSTILYAVEDGSNGFYTFMSIFKLLQDRTYVPPGVYTEYFKYSFFLESNIYTMFRGLINDFGLFGSLIFTMISSLVAHGSFRRILIARIPILSVSVFIVFVGYIYSSFIISLFIWNSGWVLLITLSTVLFVNGHFIDSNRVESEIGNSLQQSVIVE